MITDGFVAQAQQHPEQLAIEIGGTVGATRSYGELLAAAQQIAERIAESIASASHSPHPYVALLLPNSIEFLELFLGITMAGGVVLVLDPKWTETQLQQVLQSYVPDFLYVSADRVSAIAPSCPPIKTVVVSPGLPKSENLDGNSLYCSHNHPKQERTSYPTAPFYIGFTSGTTGRPKGVIRSHQSWVASFAASRIEFGTHSTDRILVPGSLTHSLSLYAALECLNAGASLYLLPKFSAKAALTCLHQHSIKVLVAVPTLLSTIARSIRQTDHPIPGLRAVIAGGSKLQPTLREELPHAFPGANILEYFGALELSFISIASSCEAVPPESVGRPFAGVQVSIRRQDGSEAEPGEVGWIGVKSPMVSLGYGAAEPSSEASGFQIQQGWATVGDLGWQDANGYLYIAGREQEMVVSGGVNIYPSEVETAVRTLPEVDEVAAFGIPDVERGQVVGVAIRWVDRPLTRTQIQQQLQKLLPSTKQPRHFFTVNEFPLTASGKISRTQLRQQLCP